MNYSTGLNCRLTDRLWDRYVLPAAIAARLSDDACEQGWYELAETIADDGPWAGLCWAKHTARDLWP
jgi:hypothetical protein